MKGITKAQAEKITTVTFYTILGRAPNKSELDGCVAKLINDDNYTDINIAYTLFKSNSYANILKEAQENKGLKKDIEEIKAMLKEERQEKLNIYNYIIEVLKKGGK